MLVVAVLAVVSAWLPFIVVVVVVVFVVADFCLVDVVPRIVVIKQRFGRWLVVVGLIYRLALYRK